MTLGDRLRARIRHLAKNPEDQRSVAPVFFLTLAVMAAMPYLASTQWGRGLTTLLVGLSAVVALNRTGAHSSVRRAAVALLAVIALVGGAGPTLIGDGEVRSTEVLGAALFALLLLVTPVVVLFRLFVRPRITVDTVAGALAAYLQIGLFFGALYRLAALVMDEPFFRQTSDPDNFEFTYFSFTTITTTGYGDLTPATPVGQSMANMEAILGQVFLVTVVALVVGNLGRQIPRRRALDAPDPATPDPATPDPATPDPAPPAPPPEPGASPAPPRG